MFSGFKEPDRRVFVVPVIGFCLLTATAQALAIEVELADILQGGTYVNDNFGASVGMDSDRLIVGATLGRITSDDETYSCGVAHIFENVEGDWQQEALLYPHDYKDPGLQFGSSVDIDGDYAVVSSKWEVNYEPGSVYVFYDSPDGWTETQALQASDAATYWPFGWSLSLDNDLLVVGTYPLNATVQGKAYVFERTDGLFEETQILTASDGDSLDYFGEEVLASEDWIFVSARGAKIETGGGGAVYVFARGESGWYEYQKLVRSDDGFLGAFGMDIAFDGESLVIGDTGATNSLGYKTGGARVFTLIDGLWMEQQKLVPERLTVGDAAGDTVGIDDGIALIGLHDDEKPFDSVFVFTYSFGVWSEQGELFYDFDGNDQFGYAISIDSGFIAIGAPNTWQYPWDIYDSVYMYAVKSPELIACEGFDTPLDEFPVTIKGKRPLPLRAVLYDSAGELVTDLDLDAPPFVQIWAEPGEGGEAVDITNDLLPSVTADDSNQFVYTPGGVWQLVLKTTDYETPGTYTVIMDSGDYDEYLFSKTCMTQFIIQ